MASSPFVTLGFSAISWIEHYLVHGPGDVQGQPVELDDEFAEFIVKAYRLNPKTGARIVRRAFLSRSKGRSKSGLAAFIADFEALGPCRFDHWAEAGEVSPWGYEYEEGEPVGRPLTYAEILCVATEEGQAGNTYDAIYYTLHPDTCSDALLADYGALDVGLTRINLPNSRGFIEPVTASNESKDGGKSTFIVADETHLWFPPAKGKFKLGKMHQTMVRNLLKRKIASGWMLETSTMYADGEGSVAQGTHDYAQSLEKAGRNDGKLLFDHRQASDRWNLNKRSERIKALREAYGPAAAWMDLESIADYWDDPQASEADFRRFWLNQPVPLDDAPQSELPEWSACGNPDLEQPPVKVIGLAVSLTREGAGIVGAGLAAEDLPALGVLDRRAGAGWLVAEAKRLQGKYDVDVVVDDHGPAADLIPALRAADVRLRIVSTDDVLDAWALLFDRVSEHRMVHPEHEELDNAVLAARTRRVRDRLTLDRYRSPGSELVEAGLLALWGLLTEPAPDAPPPTPFFLT